MTVINLRISTFRMKKSTRTAKAKKPSTDVANIQLDKAKVAYHVNKLSESVESEETIKGELSLESPKVIEEKSKVETKRLI